MKAVIAARSASRRRFKSPGAFAQVPRKWAGIKIIDRSFVAWCHSQGIRVEPWTINAEPEMRQLASLGVDAIMTDYPKRLKSILSAQ